MSLLSSLRIYPTTVQRHAPAAVEVLDGADDVAVVDTQLAPRALKQHAQVLDLDVVREESTAATAHKHLETRRRERVGSRCVVCGSVPRTETGTDQNSCNQNWYNHYWYCTSKTNFKRVIVRIQ